MKQLTWILAAGAVLVAAACGQKGPLYLPERNGTVITRPAEAPGTQPNGAAAPAPTNTPPKQPRDKNNDPQQPQ